MIRPSHILFDVVAEHVALVTPHMKRVSVDARCLPTIRAGLPAQWLKVFVPGATSGRAYTVRRFDAASGKLDLDFVLHGDNGPVSAWAARAEPGDAFKISATHPRSGFAMDPATARYLLLGDETALPAMGGILEGVSAHARVDAFIEVASSREEQAIESAAMLNLTWLHRKTETRSTSSALEAAARTMRRPDEDTVIWIAAESSVVKVLRKLALSDWGVDPSRLHAAGYWKCGEPNHRDEEASS